MASRIEEGLTIEGSVRGDGELIVAGRLRGAVTLQGTLVIEEGGSVEAEVEANAVVVSGLLSGSVLAHESLRIAPGGCVDARVRTARLAVADGAVFRGELQAQLTTGVQTPAVVPSRSRPPLPRPTPEQETVPVLDAAPRQQSQRPRGAVFSVPRSTVTNPPVVRAGLDVTLPPRMPALPRGRTRFDDR